MKNLSFSAILFLFFSFICCLIICRVFYTDSTMYLFLIWNLFLAFIPFWISKLFLKFGHSKYFSAFLFATWLLFFPNALYIITDLIHLQHKSLMPIWYDAVIVFSSALLGLILAFASLIKVEEFLKLKLKKTYLGIAIPFLLLFGSFGVYLGRFLRWNSWDIIQNPLGLVSSITERFINPLAHLRTWGLTVILFSLFYILYVGIKKMPAYLKQAL